MNTLEFIKKRYKISDDQKSPIKLRYSRFTELPRLFKNLGFKVGAEIGVSRGLYSKNLFLKIPKLKMYCIDPWEAYNEYVEYHDEHGQTVTKENYTIAMERLNGRNAVIIQKFSMDAVKDFEDNSLDFVFIDGNHSFEYVINDIAEWSKKVRPGGIIAGHDYWTSSTSNNWTEFVTDKDMIKLCQVKDAVDGWTKANNIQPWFVFTYDKCPTFFWVKE